MPATPDPVMDALFAAPLVAAVISAAALFVLRRKAPALPPDIPNRRSLHVTPVPRAGGYAVWLGYLASTFIAAPPFPGGVLAWLPAWAALAGVSALDDIREVRVLPRLAVHGAAALWTAYFLATHWRAPLDMSSVAALTFVLAVAIAWSSNLYNFMDGTDGLAASMGAIGFTAYGLVFLVAEDARALQAWAPACLAVAAAILPFLAVNRPPASMFLGDAGAVPLGYLAAVFGAAGVGAGAWPVWFPLLVFLPFVGDATLTLVRRARRGERLWEGHRGHFYQRLHQLGAGHAGTLAVYAAAMIGSAGTALVCRVRAPDSGWWALAAWIAVVCMLFATIDYHWRKKTNIPAHLPP
jgi:UDP-N-acetylmuramyl pentapeptide phosphotransferase/UDP-N-acetylglucosamine-1-phosphate transferase